MIIKSKEINSVCKPMSAELIMQLIFDCAESLENGFSTKERTVKDLFNIINMIEERGIK